MTHDKGQLRGRVHGSMIIIAVLLLSLFITSGGVSAAQTNESLGPGGYGWQQVYEVFNAATGSATRLTGAADRKYYDYGYKQIQVSARKENYWSRDSGWWYISGESTLNVTVKDASGDTVYSGTSLATSKGRHTATIPWGSDDDPGEWSVIVDDGVTQAGFLFYVRGGLKVSSINTSPSTPTTGTSVTINASIIDNAQNVINGSATDNNGSTVAPLVTAFITGAGENIVVSLTDANNDGIWVGQFTPNATGDHKVIVRASDNRTYWVDGRESVVVSVSGSFPYASLILPLFKRTLGPLSRDLSLTSILTFVFGIGLIVFLRSGFRRG